MMKKVPGLLVNIVLNCQECGSYHGYHEASNQFANFLNPPSHQENSPQVTSVLGFSEAEGFGTLSIREHNQHEPPGTQGRMQETH